MEWPIMGGSDIDMLWQFMENWYMGLLLPIGAILAGIVILIGGIIYSTSAGDAAKAKSAKDLIVGAIIGLVLLILASRIIATIIGT
jgi:hypothetical protein